MNILLVEPYFSGSHKSWAKGFQSYSSHNIEIISLPGKFWKWRMHGGAITLAKQFMKMDYSPDLILATDMLDLTTFLSLTKSRTSQVPTSIYFHENQLSYPWSASDKNAEEKRNHYGFINLSSALAADHILFNSKYHMDSFHHESLRLLKNFPDHNELDVIEQIKEKSRVLYLGVDLSKFDQYQTKKGGSALVLWNHRWEYDKNPEPFFKCLYKLHKDNIEFDVALLGESFHSRTNIFDEAKDQLKKHIVHFGFCENFSEYAKWLWKADILPVTSNQDFFGGSIVEAIYCGVYPILPNRLTYPELLSKENYDNHIYHNDNDLYDKVKNRILNIDETRKIKISASFKQFDWKIICPEYDELFISLIK
tara:strand:+ start:11514 stop:12611 length:1098 start_codon:yes stop_codon:yes gene_type:complete